MNSELQIKSKLGQGSRFSFRLSLPISKSKAPALAVSTTAAEFQQGCTQADYSNIEVLVVEDNSTNRLVIQKMLERFGIKVVLAVDGEDALYQLEHCKPSLILMDLQMPKMDGFEATRIIKARFPFLPVIALSAAVLDEDRALAQAAGVDDHLAKPLTLNALQKLLENWFAK